MYMDIAIDDMSSETELEKGREEHIRGTVNSGIGSCI